MLAGNIWAVPLAAAILAALASLMVWERGLDEILQLDLIIPIRNWNVHDAPLTYRLFPPLVVLWGAYATTAILIVVWKPASDREAGRRLFLAVASGVLFGLLGGTGQFIQMPGLGDLGEAAVTGWLLPIALYIWVSYLSGYLETGEWHPDYAEQVNIAWNIAMLGLVSLVFLAVWWLLLMLFVGLFMLIEIEVVRDVVLNGRFFLATTPIVVTGAALTGRYHETALVRVRALLLALARLLMPIFALLAAAFLGTLAARGLSGLRETPGGTSTLLFAAAVLLGIFNAALQDEDRFRPRWFRWPAILLLLSAAAFTVIAAHGIAVRILEYGITGRRYMVVIACLLLIGYAAFYLRALVRGRGADWRGIQRSNQFMGWAVIAAFVWLNTFIGHPTFVGIQFLTELGLFCCPG